ncbi:MAG TPA: mechanosensitive ion channel family protein [Thermoplasmata archaeon]|nr:mechanosensitive ion channel family protein [Thermoplasmata archaeon]
MASPDVAVARRLLRNLIGTILISGAAIVAIKLLAPHIGVRSGSDDYGFLVAGWVLLSGYLLHRTLTSAIREWGTLHDQVAQAFGVRVLVDLAIGAGMVLALFAVFNLGLTTIFYGSAFTGVVLVLATQTLLGNIFAGLMLLVATPYRIGDRISVVSASYGAFSPTYPHEMTYPAYTGRVEETGLTYTVVRLDSGRVAKIPNSVILQALVVNLSQAPTRQTRVRVTLPYTVAVAEFEAAVKEVEQSLPQTPQGYPRPVPQVADLQPTTWDGVVVLWTKEVNDEQVRDQVLRVLLARLGPKLAPVASAPARN